MNNLGKIEALLFLSGEEGLKMAELSDLIQLSPQATSQQLEKLKDKYERDRASALALIQTAGRYRLTTKEMFADLLQSYAKTSINQTLSKSAIEVLSIIAYRQPITRLEIDKLRGVSSSGVLSTLRIFNLIQISGHLEAPGHPKLYVTSDFFLDFIGINSLADLPPVEETTEKNQDL